MFMLKSLFGKIWGDANNQELIQVPAGSLYLVRPNGPQGSRECIYEDAVLAIRRTTAEYHYQLVVTKAFQDSQPELADDDDLEDERAYLIDQALDFRLSTRGKERTIVWRDLDGDDQDLLEFVIDNKQVNEVTITIFEITFLQCVYEHAFRTSHERATEEDLDQLRYKDEADQQLKCENKKQLDRKLEDAGIGSAASTSASTATTTAAKSEQDVKPAPAVLATIAPVADTAGPQIDENSTVFSARADLYLYDLKSQYFLVQERKVDVRVLEAGRYLFWLSIKGADKIWLAQKVESDMNMNFSPEQTSAVWNYFTDDRQCFSWLLRFEDQEAYSHFQKGFSQVMYETQNEEPWAKAKSDDRAYAETAFEAGEPMDVDDISESEDGNESVRTAREEEEEDDDEEEVAAALQTGRARSEESSWPQESTSLLAGQQDVNSLLAVGYKFDRSFVARGDKIGVFRHTDDNKLEHDTTINNVGTPSGKGFRPLKMMLHNQDAQMVLMDPSNKNAIFNMDLEYGKIVDEWKVHDDVQINNVVANNKYAQMTAEKTMIGHSHNGIYRIDPRLSGNKLVDSEFKQYASKNDFSVAATDSKGRLAVASNKGDIRLFDSIGKNAKTALPALGDPILGIDVSADGRYIIATCKTYLLLIDTLIGSGRYQGQLGFDRSFPADAKPQPKRLTLKPSHVAFMGSAISFSPARFNTGSDQETSIVTSTGAYVVSWSFKDVKKGNLGSYVLKRYGGEVISDEHAYGSDQAIVVAFEHDVQMAKRSQLLKPTRKSLAPTGFGR